MESSRLPIVDMVECIAEIIASQSHIMEKYTSKVSELNNNMKDMDSDMFGEYLADELEELTVMEKEYASLYKRRKEIMRKMGNGECDMDYRCLVKHSIASYQYTKELYEAKMFDDDAPEYQEMLIEASEFMYHILSRFLKTEIVSCGRCLLDAYGKVDDKDGKVG